MTINRPVLGVSALIEDGGRVLLVKRARAPFARYWSLPGGHVEAGETMAEAVVREVREETGIEVGDLRQIDFAEIIRRDGGGKFSYHFVLVVFAGRRLSGDAIAADDADEVCWANADERAGMMMTDETMRVIARSAPGGPAPNA